MAPLAVVLTSFTACGAMMLFQHDAVIWLHIVMLAAAFAILSGPDANWLRRMRKALLIGVAASVALVTIALVVGWVTDRPHFFDDGGPLGVGLLIEAYIGLPAAILAAAIGGLAAKYRARQLV